MEFFNSSKLFWCSRFPFSTSTKMEYCWKHLQPETKRGYSQPFWNTRHLLVKMLEPIPIWLGFWKYIFICSTGHWYLYIRTSFPFSCYMPQKQYLYQKLWKKLTCNGSEYWMEPANCLFILLCSTLAQNSPNKGNICFGKNILEKIDQTQNSWKICTISCQSASFFCGNQEQVQTNPK